MIKMTIPFLLTTLILSSFCFASGGHQDQQYLQSHTLYEYKVPTGSNTPIVYPLEGIKTVPFSDENYPSQSIHLLERESQLTQFKCTNCHSPHKKSQVPPQPNPHQHIQLSHGKANLSCFDCHQVKNRDHLKIKGIVKNNKRISYNQAAKLCYQCHSSQYKDWIHGAHGKRVGNWTGKRVIYSCTQCHNPHKPGFEKRLPLAHPKMRGFEKK